MKKAIWLAGLFLCASAVYAAETHPEAAAEGKKRNEELYERTLDQTGWTNEKQLAVYGGIQADRAKSLRFRNGTAREVPGVDLNSSRQPG